MEEVAKKTKKSERAKTPKKPDPLLPSCVRCRRPAAEKRIHRKTPVCVACHKEIKAEWERRKSDGA